ESTDGISPDSDIEADLEGVVDADEIINHKMGDPNKEISEEDADKASELRSQAMAKSSEGDLEAAIELFTEGIIINPTSSILYAKRASLYVRLVKPNAAIQDCFEAIKLNPDSAQGYKWRGK
ncbi:hypothetical protein, partial [Salmonella sp. s51228]|uniref:hypothetical protein n=1 Tax=Salmonella sp. s51228 TaxID=3159652 RepID=UPI003981524C